MDKKIIMDPNGNRSGVKNEPNAGVLRFKIDVDSLPTISCPECDGILWTRTLILKKVSAIQSPTGKDEILPIEAVACRNCSHILSMDEVK